MDNRFRREVYQVFEHRADAGMDLVDALTSAPTVESPVGMSESPLFRRGFSSVYDFLELGRILLPRLRRVLLRNQPEEAERIAGYELYATDCTKDPALEAETLRDQPKTGAAFNQNMTSHLVRQQSSLENCKTHFQGNSH